MLAFLDWLLKRRGVRAHTHLSLGSPILDRKTTMNAATIVRLPAQKKTRAVARPRATSVGYAKRLRRQHIAACGVAVVGIVLTALSLSHLAAGIALVTGAPALEAWALAIGVDLGFLALELAQLSAATPAVRRQIERFSRPAIVATLAVSAALNAFAFGAASEGLMLYPAAALGVAVPALIYALSRVAFGLSVAR